MSKQRDYWHDPKHDIDRVCCCKDAQLVEFEREYITQNFNRDLRVLDMGCGNPDWIRGYFKDVTSVDKNPTTPLVQEGDLFDFKHLHQFDLVIAKRVLCNLGDYEHTDAVDSLRARGKELLVIDVFHDEYHQMNLVREELGLEPLKQPEYNTLVNESSLPRPARSESVAADYLLWTRALAPKIAGGNLPFEGCLRSMVPNVENADRVGYLKALWYVNT